MVTHNQQGNGPYSCQIQGELYDWSGSLAPCDGEELVSTQLYIYNQATALKAQHRQNTDLNPFTPPDLARTLQGVLWNSHSYATVYHHAHELLQWDRSADFSMLLHCIVQPPYCK